MRKSLLLEGRTPTILYYPTKEASTAIFTTLRRLSKPWFSKSKLQTGENVSRILQAFAKIYIDLKKIFANIISLKIEVGLISIFHENFIVLYEYHFDGFHMRTFRTLKLSIFKRQSVINFFIY